MDEKRLKKSFAAMKEVENLGEIPEGIDPKEYDNFFRVVGANSADEVEDLSDMEILRLFTLIGPISETVSPDKRTKYMAGQFMSLLPQKSGHRRIL